MEKDKKIKYKIEKLPLIMSKEEFEEFNEMIKDKSDNGLEDEKLQLGQEYKMKKGGKVKMHKMSGGKIMKNSDMKKNKKMGGGMMQDSMGYKKGGTVRGGRSEIKGTRTAKLY